MKHSDLPVNLPDNLSLQAPFIPTVRDVRATEQMQAFLWFTSLLRHLEGKYCHLAEKNINIILPSAGEGLLDHISLQLTL
jgi:hypothetical protein